MEEHHSEVDLQWGGPGVATHSTLHQQDSLAPLHFSVAVHVLSSETGLLVSSLMRQLQCYSFSWGNAVCSGKGSALPEPERNWHTYWIEKSPSYWFLIGSSLCKWALQVFTVWLIQKALFWLVGMEAVWLVSEDAKEDVAAQFWLDEESLSLIGWNRIPGTPLWGAT